MGIAIIILIAALEITLVAFTFTKQSETVQWLKNRTLVRAVETALLLGILLLPGTHMKWRFIGALITLAILLLIAGVRWLVRRRAIGTKKKSGVILSAILTVLLLVPALVPAFLFTDYNGLETTGAYGVRECSAILIDSSRTDPFETDGSFREVPVHFYYPDADGSFPLVVFSHGAFGYYQSNYSTYAELVSNGYVVAALDHPHHAFFTKDSDGTLITVDPQFLDDAINLEAKSAEEQFALFETWMALRTADMRFVLDTVEAAKSSGTLDERQYEVPITDIFYIESIDSKVFLYTKDKVFETKQKIYEFEALLREKHFLRVSKSTLLNLMKVSAIKPALSILMIWIGQLRESRKMTEQLHRLQQQG